MFVATITGVVHKHSEVQPNTAVPTLSSTFHSLFMLVTALWSVQPHTWWRSSKAFCAWAVWNWVTCLKWCHLCRPWLSVMTTGLNKKDICVCGVRWRWAHQISAAAGLPLRLHIWICDWAFGGRVAFWIYNMCHNIFYGNTKMIFLVLLHWFWYFKGCAVMCRRECGRIGVLYTAVLNRLRDLLRDLN